MGTKKNKRKRRKRYPKEIRNSKPESNAGVGWASRKKVTQDPRYAEREWE